MKNWKDINWTKTELEVYDLQRKIYISSVDVESKKKALTRKYQKELVESHEAKLVAIRRITQRIELLNELQLDGSANSIKGSLYLNHRG